MDKPVGGGHTNDIYYDPKGERVKIVNTDRDGKQHSKIISLEDYLDEPDIMDMEFVQKIKKNCDDGTINVHGSAVEEIRYRELGTGIRYKHKFKKGKIKVKRGKIQISPAKVAPEGIVS